MLRRCAQLQIPKLKSRTYTCTGPAMPTQPLPTQPPSPPPRPSASCVVLNHRNEVLLVQRNPNASSFAGMYVFPGGNDDPAQDTSPRMTAIRETFEETGILLASPSPSPSSPPRSLPTASVLDDARKAVHAHHLRFRDFLDQHHLDPDEDALLPFTQWITPPMVKRRFHTHFFVTFLPSDDTNSTTTTATSDRLPTPDGGQEVITARFIHVADALAEFQAGRITLMPPQFYILTTLAQCFSPSSSPSSPSSSERAATTTKAQREAVQRLSQGPFGRMIINPRRLGEKADDGSIILTYEGDESRGGPPGRWHRARVHNFDRGSSSGHIVLHRSFDIFNDIDPSWFSPPAKL